MSKKILGIDLGVTSIGWSLIEEQDDKYRIISMGTRIIPLSKDENEEFTAGRSISKNQERTAKRTQRKGYDRYQLRRKALTEVLIKNNMFDPNLFKLGSLDLWGLRAKAVNEKISLTELGRVLYHFNQKRGYKSGRKIENADKKDTDYVLKVKNRYEELKERGITIGEKFYYELKNNIFYRIKEQCFPREAHIEEFDKIMECQKKYYPNILTDDLINHIKNEIIYYQRPLKSQKGLVSVCDFEGFWIKAKKEKEIFVGPKVAPKSSPLFQVTKIWETINNIEIKNKYGEILNISIEKKQDIFDYLDKNEKLSQEQLFKILDIKKEDGWYGNKLITKGIQGNTTKAKILKALNGLDYNTEILNFNLRIIEYDTDTYLVNRKTGEIIEARKKKIVSTDIEKEPLYKLWHVIYSISDIEECKKSLINKFGLSEQAADKLAQLDFTTSSFGNKSAKAMRKILPYLMDGYKYSDACSFAGYNHSFSFTKDEILKKQLKDKIELLPKNSLRQPVVEKLLNQLINLVNAIIDENRGWVTREERLNNKFEIRIELARELKQSKKERNETFKNLQKREKDNKKIAERLLKEYRLKPTRNNIIKWRLLHEINLNNNESRVNATCIYCGQQFGITDALNGDNIDIEHIIPKSLFFDDSQNNKILVHRACNAQKGNRTAFDYMSSLGKDKLEEYTERVKKLYTDKSITKAKRDKLLTSYKNIPKDFIERQLRETQYIARKAKEILNGICYNVWSTSGNVTEYLRRIWGWDDVLMDLQIQKYREHNLTEWVEWETNGQIHRKEVIKDWSKRNDHRNHAIDALVIASTQQGFIQRINNLSSQTTRDEMFAEVQNQSVEFREKLNLLDKYLISKRPFTTEEVKQKVSEILVSFRPGKKVATYCLRKIKKDGKKIVVQEKIITPRGPLSEESIYGKIKIIDKDEKNIKYLFQNSKLIVDNEIKKLIEERLNQYENDPKKAIDSLKKDPIYLDKEKKIILEKARCYKEEYVIKYPIHSINSKDAEYIVDEKIKQLVKQRLKENDNKPNEAFKEPLYFDKEKQIPIKTVRCFTGLTAVEPIKKDSNGNNIGFVKPGNNHHIAIYEDNNGNKIEHVCTFWHAVERKKFGIPIIINHTNEVWNKILNSEISYPQSFLDKLPGDNLKLILSLQQNEMFLLGLTNQEIENYIKEANYKKLSEHLYRVQKISYANYFFRHHIETQLDVSDNAKILKKFYELRSIASLLKLNPRKVNIDNLGFISLNVIQP